MNKYVNVEELLNGIYCDNPKDVMLYIANFPYTEMSEEVKKGRWKVLDFHGVRYTGCSVCGAPIPIVNRFTDLHEEDVWYCPRCGASMVEKEERS